MLKDKKLLSTMVINMAKQERIPIVVEDGVYKLFKNESEKIHGIVRFQGDVDETFAKLIQGVQEKQRRKNENRKY